MSACDRGGHRAFVVLGLAIGLVAGLVGEAWTARPAEAVRISPAGAESAAVFWTAARMRSARPLDLHVPGPATTAERRSIRPYLRSSLPAGEGMASSSVAAETVADPTAAIARRNGAVFFVTPFGLGRCSGTSVQAPNFSMVVTAAHCISSGGPHGWYDRRWVFVPGYRYGQRPFGVFPAKWIDTTRPWLRTRSVNHDVGAAVVTRNAQGELLAKAVGGARIALGLKARQVFDVHGYPAAPPFDGETQQVCSQTPFLGHDARSFVLPGPLNLAVECNVTGGASGGGWTTAGGALNSVTSYGYMRDSATTFGPYFGKEAGRLFARARRVR